MSDYKYKLNNEINITRVGLDMLELEIGGKKAKILTEDLAALVSEELPKDRARDMLSAIEEKMISKGTVRIKLKATRDMRKGEEIRATMDITRYMADTAKREDRAAKAGIAIPALAGLRTNNQGFII